MPVKFLAKTLMKTTATTVLASLIFYGCKTTQSEDSSDVKYFGYDNQRFRMKFSNHFLMAPTSDEDAILKESSLSLKHLFGVFHRHNEFLDHKGIPPSNPHIEIISKEIVEVDGVSKLKVSYMFDDIVVFNKDLKKSKIELWLPKARSGIYAMGLGEVSVDVEGQPVKKTKNLCTDEKYNSESDFWYFWNPEIKGCPATFKTGLNRVQATLTPVPNTLNKYPLFGKLGTTPSSGKNGKKLIYIAQGVDKNYDETDVGTKSFFDTVNELLKTGFEETKRINDGDSGKHWVLEKSESGYDIEIHIGLLKSKLYEDGGWVDNKSFIDYTRMGLMTADVFIYNGHSGLGGTLPPSRLVPLDLPTKYQVFFFNGCSTYSYYNDNYFEKKKEATDRPGSERLEIVTTGLESFFGVQPFVTASLINDLIATKNHGKWETIIKNLYSQTSKFRYGETNQWQMDPKKYSAQFQVNGDEDNPSDLATALKP